LTDLSTTANNLKIENFLKKERESQTQINFAGISTIIQYWTNINYSDDDLQSIGFETLK